MFTIDEITALIEEIRREYGFESVPFTIEELIYDKKSDRLFIIAQDRPDKSAVIGNGLIVGKLREKLGIKLITVHSKLDLLIKRRILEKNLKRIKGTFLEFLTSFIESELRYPPRNLPKLKNNGRALVFLSFNAKALLGFAEHFGLKSAKVGIRYTFPKWEYESIEGTPREVFFPDEEKLTKIAKEKNIKLVLADFPFDLKFSNEVALLNPMRFFHIGFFEIKHLFGFQIPMIIDREALLDFILKQVKDGLMEPSDAARLIYRNWKRSKMEHKVFNPSE